MSAFMHMPTWILALTAFCLAWVATPAHASNPPTAEEGEVREVLEVYEQELQTLRTDLASQREETQATRAEVERLRRTLAREQGTLPYTDRVTYGDRVVVDRGERVTDVVAFGNDVEVAGHVIGDATAFGGSVFVLDGGIVEGDALSFGGRVHVEPNGQVGGDRVAMARGSSATGSLGGTVTGFLTGLTSQLILLLSFAGAGVMVVGLVPQRVTRIAEHLEERPIRSVLVGGLSTVFIGFAAFLFAITFIGLPISFVLGALLSLAWLMGFVGLCQAIGDRLPFESRHHGRWLAFLIGTVLITFFGSLPWVGFLAVMMLSVAGVGASLGTRFGAY